MIICKPINEEKTADLNYFKKKNSVMKCDWQNSQYFYSASIFLAQQTAKG
jgi:hypothetical protein